MRIIETFYNTSNTLPELKFKKSNCSITLNCFFPQWKQTVYSVFTCTEALKYATGQNRIFFVRFSFLTFSRTNSLSSLKTCDFSIFFSLLQCLRCKISDFYCQLTFCREFAIHCDFNFLNNSLFIWSEGGQFSTAVAAKQVKVW